MRRTPLLTLVLLAAGAAAACDNTDVTNRANTTPGAESEAQGANVDVQTVDLESQRWFRESGTVDFDGRTWILSGEPLFDPAVERVGEYQGTPLYAEVNTAQPYSELFIPLENDLWQMLVPGDAGNPVGNPAGTDEGT